MTVSGKIRFIFQKNSSLKVKDYGSTMVYVTITNDDSDNEVELWMPRKLWNQIRPL